jgi:hypothetical protein
MFFTIRDHLQQKDFLQDLGFLIVKTIAIVICGKCLVEAFGFAFVSLSCLPFQKIIVS